MGAGTSSGKSGTAKVASNSSNEAVTKSSISSAFASLKTGSGFLGHNQIQAVADTLDKVAQGTRIEIKNTPTARIADYYEKTASGWVHSHVVNGAITGRNHLQGATQAVISILQQGVLQHPDRLRII